MIFEEYENDDFEFLKREIDAERLSAALERDSRRYPQNLSIEESDEL